MIEHQRQPDSAAIAAAMRAADTRHAPRLLEVTPLGPPFSRRRWESADTNRTNQAHWQNANGQDLNADLAANLITLRNRCALEVANNPLVEGVIMTHATDIWGPDGPRLQILSDDVAWNDAAEQLWRAWWACPDINGQLGGADLGHQCTRLWWTKGEHLLQFTTAPNTPLDEISLRLQPIDPARLDTAPTAAGDPDVALGIRRSSSGAPLGYQIGTPRQFGPYALGATQWEEIPAAQMVHQFLVTEPGQVRGIPWLAPSLQAIADLRDFDQQVLDAARLAASQGVVWWTEHPDSVYEQVNESVTMERNVQQTGPPGWKPEMVDPKQPQAQYVEFRGERAREIGRPVSMPLMKILLGSEKHSFASARMDNQNYQRACECLQGWTARRTMTPILARFLREAQLLRSRRGAFVLPPRPASFTVRWMWTRQPHVDPLKEANAERVQLESGTLPFAEACALLGRDEDEVIHSRARTAQKLTAAGLPAVPVATTSQDQDSTPDDPSETD